MSVEMNRDFYFVFLVGNNGFVVTVVLSVSAQFFSGTDVMHVSVVTTMAVIFLFFVQVAIP